MAKINGTVSAFAIYSKKRKKIENLEQTMKNKKHKVAHNFGNEQKLHKVFKMGKEKKKKKKKIIEIDNHKKYLMNGIKSGAQSDQKKIKNKKTNIQNEKVLNNVVLHHLIVENDVSVNKYVKSKKNKKMQEHLKNKKIIKSKKKYMLSNKSTESNDCSKIHEIESTQLKFHSNPLEDSKMLFSWLIYPLDVDTFFKNNWEKTPLHIKRKKKNYYQKSNPLISTPMIDEIIRTNHIFFTKNIDITSYTNGIRETHNPIGRAFPSVVWDYYQNDCSIRMLNPQTFIPKLHNLNATLQEFFGCFVGANAYLTPPNSQGFAPHYDDIEAFILQVEGKKRWRLYKSLTDSEYLPRYSSKNFDPSEIGEPIMDTVVSAGDLLYFPRGTIHQGETIDNTHSLHITLSVYQKNSWGDFLEKLLPEALKQAIESNSKFREGLPLNYLRYIGSVHTNDNEMKKHFTQKIKSLFSKIFTHIDINKAADEMAKGHIHDFLPPVLYPEEAECSVLEDGEIMEDNGKVVNQTEIEPDTRVRLTRAHSVRLVEEKEENTYKVYFSCENSKEYHEFDLQCLEISAELAPAVKEIILSYPNFIRVEDLPVEGLDNKIQVVKDLWEKCIVITEQPLPVEI